MWAASRRSPYRSRKPGNTPLTMAAVNASPSGVDRLTQGLAARSGASQHGACSPASCPRAAPATSAPHPAISSPWEASARSSSRRVNHASSGSMAANSRRGCRLVTRGAISA